MVLHFASLYSPVHYLREIFLTQTEYLEETGLRAEARGHASERGCSHPLDVEPCAIGYTNILPHMLLRRGVRLAAIVFCF